MRRDANGRCCYTPQLEKAEVLEKDMISGIRSHAGEHNGLKHQGDGVTHSFSASQSETMLLKPNASKCSPPKLPAVLSRQRLNQKLRNDGDHHLVLVIGQAAQGKSTLIADHLADNPAPVAWMHLDSHDGDCANFHHLFVCALAQCLADQTREEYVEQAHIALSTSDAVVRYEAMLRAIWQRLSTDITVVLDGLEQIPVHAESQGLIQLMIKLAADKGRIIILSREMPPFKIQHWLMRRQVLILDNDALAFTPEEIGAYFTAEHGVDLPKAGVEDLFNITEGWAGGLALISQAFSRRSEDRWDDFLANRLPNSLSDDAWRYFAEEVFDDQPEKIKNYLTQAALVDVIEPDQLSPLFEEIDITSELDDLVRRHLFIQQVHSSRKQPAYRLNHMFRDFLRRQFEKRFDPDTQRRIYHQIAELYQNQRRAEVAIDYFYRAGSPDAAVECIKKVGTDLVIRGRFADLELALSGLTQERIQNDPWLLFLLTLTRRIKGGVRNIEDFEKAVHDFSVENDIRGHMLAMAFLIEAQVFSGNDPAICQRWIHRAEALLAAHRDTPYFSFARALLWLQIGFGYIASGLDLTKGVSACQNAYLMAHKINAHRLMANAKIVSVMGLALRGDFIRADEALEKISVFADTDAYTEYHILRRLVNVQLALHRGDLKSAQKQLAPLADEIEKFGLLFLYPAYLDTKGFAQIYAGDFEAARDTCRHLLDAATLSGNSFYKGLSYRLSAILHYFQGHHYDAVAAAEKSLELLLSDGKPTLHWMHVQQLIGLNLIHLQKFEAARKCLDQAKDYFEKSANILSLSETYLSRALLADACGQKEKTIENLSNGFSIAFERQLDHFMMLGPADIERCCRLATQLLDPFEIAWAEHLLLSMSKQRVPIQHTPSIKAPETNEAHQLPQERHGEYLEIRTFGGFRVLRNGQTPIEDNQWGGNRTKLLLKAILVHGIQDIPKDIIMEDLWPESAPRSASQNFKVTLHRLRKKLEPTLQNHGKSAYVHLNSGLVSLDRDLCQVDVQSFLTCCKDIKRAVVAKETGTALALGRMAMDLYQGDFLPEEPYAPWVEMKRLALKVEYIATLMMMVDIYEKQDQLEEAASCCRAVLSADACLEQANAKLMQIYAQQGRKNDAVTIYRKLETILKEDLGVQPDPAITALFHQICE